MKRKLTLFLSAVMATSCLPMTAYAANFKDINDVPWASGVINSVADKGLLSGYEDGTFRGKNNVTYCEAMQMVYTAMTKSGATASMDAVSVYGYMQALDTMNVPKWAQMAVAYGLSEGILDMQMVATKFAGGKTVATREDVAIIFGNAVGKMFGKEKDTSAAKGFADYWNISSNALEQVHLLKKMNIISGDENKKFNPKQNINRAEMAVMLNKTYDAFHNGIGATGKIDELTVNKGVDGTSYYYLSVKLDDGGKETFMLTEGDIPVYAGSTDEKISMSKLSEGDSVVIVYSGTEVLSIRQMAAISAQEKYDVTGYVENVKDSNLYLENENTGESTTYKMEKDVLCYVNGESVSKNKVDDILKENYKDYAYAGLITEVKREKVNGAYQNVTYVKELHITFVQEYTVRGEVVTYSRDNITVKLADGDIKKNYILTSGCKLYLDNKESDYAELKKMVSDGTVYVKVVLDTDDKAISVTMSGDTFVQSVAKDSGKTYEATSLTERKLVLDDNGEKITYNFDSNVPVENVRFYTWNAPNEDWESVEFADAKLYADATKYTDKNGDPADVSKIYAKVGFNSGGKLNEVYLSAVRTAWKTADESRAERKGTVASVVDDVLKFEGSSTGYTLLKKYEDGDLLINGGSADTKTLLTKMANDEGISLYAEIVANGENEITKIIARPTEAVGKIVKWSRSDKLIEIETEDGNTFKLKTQKNPKLTDAEEMKLTLDDIESVTYRGEWIKLGLTGSGTVEKFTLVDGPKDLNITDKVKGIATAAYDGLEVDGKVYSWYGKTAEIEISNFSCPQESLNVVKDLIEDPDVEVYVEATLNDDGKVEAIKVYVKEAEGELTAFDTSVRILTDSGNRFSFNRKATLEACDINGWDQTDVEEFDRGIGMNVLLTFSDRGEVCEMAGK